MKRLEITLLKKEVEHQKEIIRQLKALVKSLETKVNGLKCVKK